MDLLDAYPVKHVRLTTRCCDGVPIKRAEVSRSSPIVILIFELIPESPFSPIEPTLSFSLQVRVGNSTEPGDNQLCNWIPKEIEEGATEVLDCYEDLVGR